MVGCLPSLMRVPSQDDKVKDYTFYHKSLFDFLEDPKRSPAFPAEGVDVSEAWIKQRFARILSCTYLLSKAISTSSNNTLRQGPGGQPTSRRRQKFLHF